MCGSCFPEHATVNKGVRDDGLLEIFGSDHNDLPTPDENLDDANKT